MNKKVLIIGGGIVVIGVGAYLYFMNKSKKEALLSGATTPTTSGATTPTTSATTTTSSITSAIDSQIPPLSTGGIVTPTTKAPTIQEQENLDIANDIVVKIKDYYKKSASFQTTNSMFQPSTFNLNPIGTKLLNPYPILINKLKDDLLKLGYEYKGTIDGVLVKL
jgi:hypothetical protein